MKKTYKKWIALLAAGSLLVSTPAVFNADDTDSTAAETVVTNEVSVEESKPAGEAAPAEKAEAPAEPKVETPAETKTEAPAETKEEAPAETKSEAPAETKEEAPAEAKSENAEDAKPAESSESKSEEKTEAGTESKEEAKSSDEKGPESTVEEAGKSEEGKAEAGKADDKAEDQKEDAAEGEKAADDKKEDAAKAEDDKKESGDAKKDGEKAKSEKDEEKKADEKADQKDSAEAEKKDEKKEEEKQVTQFTGSARIERVGSGDIYEGDEVTLKVIIDNANRSDYQIRWEEKAESTWVSAAQGSSYTFAANETKVAHVFRAVLYFQEEGVKEVNSNELRLPALKVKEEEKKEDAVEQFTGSIVIGRAGDGDLYDGDEVTLQVTIEKANRTDSTIRWEAKAEVSWQPQAEGTDSFTFAVNEARAGHTYRAVLSFDEEGVKEVASNELKLPALSVKEEEKAEETAEEAPVERSVTIATSGNADTQIGDTITLTSSLTGFDGVDAISYQWKCDRGNGFEAVAGANDSSYSFEVTEESLNWSWQLDVTCSETK